jgi:NADPH:quinone reductase-like Zn-dependent oxidoreductase
MKVVVYTRIWDPRRSSVDGCEMPVPMDNEVLIKVHAVSNNASD